MGGSASAHRLMDGLFVDDKLKQGEKMLKLNSELRTSFVKYIKDCRWTGALVELDGLQTVALDQPTSSSSTWTKFGYKSPHCSGVTKSVHKDSTIQSSSVSGRSKYSSVGNVLVNRCQMLQSVEQRAVLIAVLLPFFLESSGVGDTGDNSITDDWRNEEITTQFYTQIRVAPAKEGKTAPVQRGRIGDWLVNAAAKLSKVELEEYLANPSGSWIRDFHLALHSLPATVTLSRVDPTKQESRIIYANSSQGTTSQMDANMHDLYSADCSPGGAQQVRNAVFGAKKYKRCATSYDGTCRLRALKPVYDNQGKHVYTLGLESRPFKDPVLSLQGSVEEVDEEVFQQMEDLLVLMPLLVRNYKCFD